MPRFDNFTSGDPASIPGITRKETLVVLVTAAAPSIVWNPATHAILDILFLRVFSQPTLTIFLDAGYTASTGDEITVITTQGTPFQDGLIMWSFPVRFTFPVTDPVPTAGSLAQTKFVAIYEVFSAQFLVTKTPYP